MKIQDDISRRTQLGALLFLTVLFALIASVFVGAIIVFWVMMPNDQYGWQGTRDATLSFLPGLLIFGYATFECARELKTTMKLPASAFKGQDKQSLAR